MRGFDAPEATCHRAQEGRMLQMLPIGENSGNAATRPNNLIGHKHRIKSRTARVIGRYDRAALKIPEVLLPSNFDAKPPTHGLDGQAREKTGQQARRITLRMQRLGRLAQRQNLGCPLSSHQLPLRILPRLPASHECPFLLHLIRIQGLESKFMDRYFPKIGLRNLNCFFPIVMQALSDANGTSRNWTKAPGHPDLSQEGTSNSMDLILAIDQGTTGTTSLLMDSRLNRVAEASIDFEQHFPKPGWVEHDLENIWTTVLQTVREVTRNIDIKQIAAIGITNQRETLCFWDRKTLKPLARALVWQDRRTADQCRALRERGLESKFQEATGLLLDPYFSGTKAAWALKNQESVAKAAREGTLCAGTIDSYLLARLTGGTTHATEPSNASRTLCFNINTRKFDAELCELLGVPLEIWPEVRPSAGIFGITRNVPGLPDGIPISGMLGDQQAALMGQACTREGMAKCTYGTGAFILMNTGRTIARSKHRLLTTIAWSLRDGDITYALEGSAFIAGAAVQWARDGMKLIRSAEEIEALASSVPDSHGVTFVPALTGLGAPWWNPDATGMFTGLTRGTTQAHMARAILEGIAFQNADILTAMQKDLGRPIESLNVDGGAAANNLLMQFQSDVLGVKLRRPKYLETTSLGAVFAAGLGAGIWTDLVEVERTWKEDRTFAPEFDQARRSSELARWSKAVARVNWMG